MPSALPRPTFKPSRVDRPITGISGLLFDDFETAPAFQQQQQQADAWKAGGQSGGQASQQARERSLQTYASRQLYAASMSLIGAPAAQWRSEAAMMYRGYMASQRRRGAAVRGQKQPMESATVPPPPPEEPPPPPDGIDLAQSP